MVVMPTHMHHASSWMPTSLLPPRPLPTAAQAKKTMDEKKRIVAWRLHIRDIRAEGLPSGAAFGRNDWTGLNLRFIAVWSRETKKTAYTKVSGSYHWPREHATLALPNSTGVSVPESEISVELCARVPNEPDEVVGVAKVSIASRVRARTLLSFLFLADARALSLLARPLKWTTSSCSGRPSRAGRRASPSASM